MKKEKTGGPFYLWLIAFVFSICFTVLIWLLGPFLQPFLDILLPDQGAAWYYWKLPTRDFLTMFIAWTFYLGHQFAAWATIFHAKKNPKWKFPKVHGLSNYNLAMFGINTVFVFIHLVQTHVWFDGLAQDVPIWTSQGSVIVMLSFILIIEHPRRGLFLGRKVSRPFTSSVARVFRRNHMYIIAWALVYTFWFHPMSYDPQLLSGFFYMFLLFTQMSLAYTRVHFDKKWIITLESYVAIHAVIVAIYNTAFFQSADMWPMFFSGFTFMFVFTYLYALKVKKLIMYLITISYFAFLIWLYLPIPIGLGRNLDFLFRLEFLWIPAALYGLAIALAGSVYVLSKYGNRKD
ncbi:MAG: hypothetical protein ACXACA_05780 [Candidatus Ranarchaeia archaeon]